MYSSFRLDFSPAIEYDFFIPMRDLSPDDASLIALIAQARMQAFDHFYDRYNRLVFSIACGILGDRALAEEVTMDVFVQVWKRAGTYHAEQGKVSSWLIAISRNRAIDMLRWQRSHPESGDLEKEESFLPDGLALREAEESAELSLERQRVQAALDQLPGDQREALMLAYFKGYTQSQIARTLDQPLGTVKTRIRLGMQKLRHLLEKP